MEILLTSTTIAALFGAYLVSKGNVKGFWIWCITNAIFCLHNFTIEQYQMSALFAAYLVLAANGIRNSACKT